MRVVGRVDRFFQAQPHVARNLFEADSYFQSVVSRVAAPVLKDAKHVDSLRRLGERCGGFGDVTKLGLQAEKNPPQLVQYDAWGHRVDRIEVSAAWDKLKDISAQEGLVSTGYDRARFGEFARVAQFQKMYLFYGANAYFGCPLAMTDGCARLLELHTTDKESVRQNLSHLLSNDPAQFWTSGQHMTERTGGSDVANSETIAVEQPDGSFALHGYKFFTSATTSECAVALARIVDEKGNAVQGSKGLSCFFIRLKRDEKTGKLEGITVHRLKDKLGTKAVPTAELEFNGVRAVLLGQKGRGVATIASVLNITRWQNGVQCVSLMRRAMSLVQSHAQQRQVFGAILTDKPLHMETVADMEVEARAAIQFVTHVSLLLGKEESGKGTESEAVLLRLLTPLLKLYTAKQTMWLLSEAIECLGGVGYCEDSGLPQMLRDAQTAPVWEGTTNVLSLDVWRPIAKERGLEIFLQDIADRVKAASPSSQALRHVADSIVESCKRLADWGRQLGKDVLSSELYARSFAFSLSRTYMLSLLLAHAHHTRDQIDAEVAVRFLARNSLALPQLEEAATRNSVSKAIAMQTASKL